MPRKVTLDLTGGNPAAEPITDEAWPVLVRYVKDHCGPNAHIEMISPDRRFLIVAIDQTPEVLPGVTAVFSKPGLRPQEIAALEAKVPELYDGRALVAFDPHRGGLAAWLLPVTKTIRDRAAALVSPTFGPWNVSCAVDWAVDEETGLGRIDSVVLGGLPPLGETALNKLRDIIPSWANNGSPDTSSWAVEADTYNNRVTLSYRRARQLPKVVDGTTLLPAKIDPTKWERWQVGVKADGAPFEVDLTSGPHSMAVGGTGSGKTVYIAQAILSAIARGFRVVFIDEVKKGNGIRDIEPYCDAFAVTGLGPKGLEQAASILKSVYVEVEERVNLNNEHHAADWSKLPPQLGVRPILVVIDEYSSLISPEAKPVGLERDDPILLEWQEEANAKAQIKKYVAKIAREARSSGVHLLIGSQTAYAHMLDGETRANLGTALYLIPPKKVPPNTLLGMVFDANNLPLAVDEISDLNDGVSRGLAVGATEGGEVAGFRVGYIPNQAAYLESIGAPRGQQLRSPREDSAVTTPRHPARRDATDPTKVKRGEVSFSLADLEPFADPTPPADDEIPEPPDY
ncbi:FtsK/SpoIIIE domain-containing protein [Leifsonia sp. fls2-241-R2A-40a]|uniref:FtsK/SpoIIIE domain-containing protein n=1 Tax=Leifsonia sp. fls2-241-R2A-40a TaxID=3040290 RepID=UPI0025511D7B|nr:FtsK/SpoIIIE domain-containing protein [Leifsonia sp. fls2-241-R2A-40a]